MSREKSDNPEFEGGGKYLLMPVRNFKYNQRSKTFIVSDSEKSKATTGVGFRQGGIYNFLTHTRAEHHSKLKLSEGLAIDDHGNLVVMPELRKLLSQLPSAERERIEKMAKRAMYQKYIEIHDIKEFVPSVDSKKLDWMFGAKIGKNGLVTLKTFGDCACLGPDADGHFGLMYRISIDEVFDDPRVPYSTISHNAHDNAAQLPSLYAGMGTIAAHTAKFYARQER